MRRIKKIELEKEIITCDTCGTDFEGSEYATFECMACHKDVCGNCAKRILIAFSPTDMFTSILHLCPHCFETVPLKKLQELKLNEE